ncbi:MAG: HAD-IIB family hydrolase [Pseudomonadota bacterium]
MQIPNSIGLVALDIDGTLLDPNVHHSAMPDDNMTRAVKAVMAAGIEVILATGRMYPGTATIGAHLGVELPLICQQGASVHNQDGSIKFDHPLDPEISTTLVDYARNNNWPLGWFDAHTYLTTHETEQARFFADVSGIPMVVHPTPHLTQVKPTGIDIISTLEIASSIHSEMETLFGDRIELLDFPSVTAIHSSAASKGIAVAAIARELGISQQHVLAIGDSVNDVSMLTWAGHSASPDHCDDYARAAAKQILPGAGVSGVCELLTQVAATVR